MSVSIVPVIKYFKETSAKITDSYLAGQISEEDAVSNYILLGCLILGIDTERPLENQLEDLQFRIDKAVLSEMEGSDVS